MITLKTLPSATAQEVFDQVRDHLLSQGEKSEEDICLYRGPRGLKCAAGCLIGDDEYKPEFEGKGWSILVGKGKIPKEHSELIGKLQEVHDSMFPEYWEEDLKLVAEEFNLKY